MNLMEYAREEVERAGLLDSDSDYDGMLGRAVLELVEVFSKQGHSGTSAALTLDIFRHIAAYEPLTPLTFEDDQWIKYDDIWQHRRKPTVFSDDRGATWYDLDEAMQPRHPIPDAALDGHDGVPRDLPIHRTAAGYPRCATCDGGGCPDCTDPA